MTQTKLLGLTAAAAATVATCGFLAGGAYCYRLCMHPQGRTRADQPTQGPRLLLEESRLWLAHHPDVDHHYITAQDGFRLHARRLPAPGHRWVMCVHGYDGSGLGMAFYAQHYVDEGWNVLLPDLRGHGQSQGDYVGMGWPDRLDLLAWLDWIILQDPDAQILLHGVSMGGATVLMATGEAALPRQVKVAVSDCAYTTAWAQMHHVGRSKLKLPLPMGAMLTSFSLIARVRAGYWLRHASCLSQVAQSHTPTLFIHGMQDHFVPTEMGQELYQAAACQDKALLLVPGAGHALSAPTDPAGYWHSVDSFARPYFTDEAMEVSP